jgi:hypothetical protein
VQTVHRPLGGWLGSGAEEDRAKLRYAPGRRREPKIRRSLNGNSFPVRGTPEREREPRESKHPSTGRKRNQ